MSVRYGRPELVQVPWWSRLSRPFWVLPSLIAVVSALVGILLPRFDEELIPDVITSGPDGARQLLGVIAGAMISVTGLVFSITMVVLQLASSQFTPRLLSQFLQSRTVQVTLGVFTGSFVYALTVLRSVRGAINTPDEFVPQVSVSLGFFYVLFAIALLVVYIQHVMSSVQVSHVVQSLGRRTTAGARTFFGATQPGATWGPPHGACGQEITHREGPGHVTALDSTGLVRWARERDCVVALDLGLGDFIAPGQPVGTCWGSADIDAAAATTFYRVAPERDLISDFTFGIQQLTDIADRALPPGLNDPTTAIQVIDELYAALRPLVEHPDPSPYLVDDDGVVRGRYRPPTLATLVEHSLAEIAHYGEDAPRVMARLREVTALLLAAAIPQHRPTLEGVLAGWSSPIAAHRIDDGDHCPDEDDDEGDDPADADRLGPR